MFAKTKKEQTMAKIIQTVERDLLAERTQLTQNILSVKAILHHFLQATLKYSI